MLKCAFISPGFLPVPAVSGGGVEQLMTTIINDNELYKKMQLDVYTLYDERINDKDYKYSKFIMFKKNKIKKFFNTFFYKVFKILNINHFPNYFCKEVIKYLNSSNEKYDYIIIENNMYSYKEIHKKYKFSDSTKFVFHLHNDFGGHDKPIALCKYIASSATKILTVSNYLKEKFEKETKCKNVVTLYNCVSLELFQNIKYDKDSIRKKYNISSNDIVFLFCGRFHPEKGLLELIKAFESLENNKCKLLIVGNSNKKKIIAYSKVAKYEKAINKKISQNRESIKVAGYIDHQEISSYFNACDIVVIPSMCEEAFGLVAIEAMAVGKALIVTNSGGLIEIVDNEFAKIVEKNNIYEDLEEAMNYYINNPKQIELSAKIGLEKINQIDEFNEKEYYNNFVKKIGG